MSFFSGYARAFASVKSNVRRVFTCRCCNAYAWAGWWCWSLLSVIATLVHQTQAGSSLWLPLLPCPPRNSLESSVRAKKKHFGQLSCTHTVQPPPSSRSPSSSCGRPHPIPSVSSCPPSPPRLPSDTHGWRQLHTVRHLDQSSLQAFFCRQLNPTVAPPFVPLHHHQP